MLIIEKALREDASIALDIRNRAILCQCKGHYPLDALIAWTAGDLSDNFIDVVEKYFYLAKFENRIVGTGMINIESGKLDAIFVDPHYMRKGIGRKLVKYLETRGLEHGLERLTLESTLNAAAFYRACGFAGNEVKNYVSPRGLILGCIPMFKVIYFKR